MSVIRLKEVASEAGVSISTASSALRGLRIVRPDTQAKVEAAARKLGYQKNSAAAVLSSLQHRGSQKAVLIAWLTDSTFSAGSKAAARVAAEDAGVKIEFYILEKPGELTSVMRILTARGCDGIVLGRGMSAVIRDADWSGFSVVSVEEILFEEGVDVVRSSLFRSTQEILRQIKAAGYQRIGVCLREHEPQHLDDETRLGAVVAFQTYNLSRLECIPLKRIPFSHPAPDRALVDWVRKYSPDVVLGFSGAELWYLQSGGFSVPDDVAYVALHVNLTDRGSLAGYQENLEVYPKYAVQILLEKIRHGIRGLSDHPQQTLVLPPLFPGSSCPRLKPRMQGEQK